MERKCSRIVAWVTSFCMLAVTIASTLGLIASADGEYFDLGTTNSNLFVNVNQEIELQDVSVLLDGTRVNGSEVSWQSSEEAVSIANGILKVSEKGNFQVTIADDNEHSTQVNVLAKLPSETEYILYEEDFDNVANGTLPEGFTVVQNGDVNPDAANKPTVYIDSPQVQNGKLYVGNGVKNAETRILLPEFLDNYSDYVVDVDFKQSYITTDNGRWLSIMLRAQRNVAGGVTALSDAYCTLARRVANQASGLEICGIVGGANSSSKALNANNLGAHRNWDSTVDWQRDAYNMHMTSTIRGTSISMDLYRHPDQPHFDGDFAQGNPGYQNTVDSPVHQASTAGWANGLTAGGIGFRTAGSQMEIDSVRVSVPVTLLDGNPDSYIPSSQQGGEDAVYDDLKFGVISDLHINDYGTGADNHLVTILEYYKAAQVSAVLVTGDVATTGLPTQYQKFNDIWDSVFDDPDTAPEKIVMTGNHEFEQAYYKKETVEDAYQHFMDAYGYDSINRHVVVGGYHFLTVTSESAAVDGKYTSATTDWLVGEIKDIIAENPYQPIFVSAHQTLPNTTYGSYWGATSTQALYDALKPYQQVVYFAGHSHYPTENERGIFQKEFTCVDVPSLQYTNTEGGLPANAYDIQGGLLVTLEGANKQLMIDRLRVRKEGETERIEKIKSPWKLGLPLFKKDFTYTDARKDDRVAPAFVDGAAVTVSDVTINSLKVSFPSAGHDDYVQGYTVYIKEKGTDNIVTEKYFVADFYNAVPAASQKTDISGLLPNMDYVVEVTAVESFGLESDPITAEFTTEPVTTPSDSVNRADFLDVDFISSFADNSPYRLNHALYGAGNNSKLVQSETLGRQVLRADGWINYSISSSMLSKISDSMTMEIAFMVPDELPKSACLFGNPESGGATIEFSGGKLQAGMFIKKDAADKGGWKFVAFEDKIKPDTWYHLIVSFDGQKVTGYLNGEIVSETAAVGTIYHNPAVPYFTVGANVQGNGNATYAFKGEIALARVYTAGLDSGAAAKSYSYFENDAYYQEIYEASLVLDSLTDEQLGDNKAAVTLLKSQADRYLQTDSLELDKVAAFLESYREVIDDISTENPSLKWKTFEEPCGDFSLVTEKSAGWQKENQPDVKKTIFSKSADQDQYLTYKVDGYIRQIDIAALLSAGFGDPNRDYQIYLSQKGDKWEQLIVSATPQVNDPIYGPGDAVAWKNSTITSAVDIGGDYSYMKLVLKEFPAGCPRWSSAVDNVKIFYSADANDIPLTDGTFVDQKPSWDLEDELTDLNKVSEKTGEWDVFPNHAETGLSVAGRKTLTADNTLVYEAPKNKVISELEIMLQSAAGFVNLAGHFGLEARIADTGEWKAVACDKAETAEINEKFESWLVKPLSDFPKNADAIRISLKNDVAWTLMIDKVSIRFADDNGGTTPPVEPGTWDFTDSLANWSNVSSFSTNWDLFAAHAETGLSVLGRRDAEQPSWVTYRPANKNITDLKVNLMIMPSSASATRDISVSVRQAGSDEWNVLQMTAAEAEDILNAPMESGKNFKTVALTPSEALAANVAEVKIELTNETLFALMLDEVSMNLADRTGVQDGDPFDDKDYNFKDEMANLDNVKETNDNWEAFEEHGETGLSVVGKLSAKKGTLIYGQDGKTITDFAFDFQAAIGFFKPMDYVTVQIRTVGSDEWTTIAVEASAAKAIDGTYSSIRFVPQSALPSNVEEVQLTLWNDVAWTLMVDRTLINYSGENPGGNGGNGEEEKPAETGVAFPAAGLFAVLSGAVLTLVKKRRETAADNIG